MNTGTKNKLLVWLVALLLVANAATITLFWLGRNKRPPEPKGSPREFLSKELSLDTKQQAQLEELVKEHRSAAEQVRPKIREAKEAFFELLKQPGVTDSAKQAAAKLVSVQAETLDLLTFGHFQKIRALCNADQQKKFDAIIQDVVRMLGQPRPPMGPGNGRQGPPPDGGPGGNHPPPPGD
jgi:Spy/CpxP family protein refolding chaperone